MAGLVLKKKPDGIGMTDAVVARMKSLIEAEKIPADSLLRIGVKGGGCSGFSYVVDFTQDTREGDRVFEKDGVKLVVDPRSYPHLAGTLLDYEKTVMSQGFVFKNPNAKSSCGCGISFDV